MWSLQAFTYGGRLCEDGTSLAAACVQHDCTVDVQRRLRGGGGDGGATGAESRVSYLEMYMSKKPDKVCFALPLFGCNVFGNGPAVYALHNRASPVASAQCSCAIVSAPCVGGP